MLLSRERCREADLRISGTRDGSQRQGRRREEERKGGGQGEEVAEQRLARAKLKQLQAQDRDAISHYIPNSDRRSVLAESGSQAAWAIVVFDYLSTRVVKPFDNNNNTIPRSNRDSLLPSFILHDIQLAHPTTSTRPLINTDLFQRRGASPQINATDVVPLPDVFSSAQGGVRSKKPRYERAQEKSSSRPRC